MDNPAKQKLSRILQQMCRILSGGTLCSLPELKVIIWTGNQTWKIYVDQILQQEHVELNLLKRRPRNFSFWIKFIMKLVGARKKLVAKKMRQKST